MPSNAEERAQKAADMKAAVKALLNPRTADRLQVEVLVRAGGLTKIVVRDTLEEAVRGEGAELSA